MRLEETIRASLLSAGDGFVVWGDAAEWLVQYPIPKDFGATTGTTAFLIGSGYLGTALTKKYGPPSVIDTEGGTTPGVRPDSADWRTFGLSRCEVSIDLLRATAKEIGNLALLKLIQDVMVERQQILEAEKEDIFCPLDHAATMLADRQWTDTEENKQLARRVWQQKCPGQKAPLENKKPCDTDEAYLWWAKHWEELEWQQAIDSLVAKGLLTLYTPGSLSPTHDRLGAFISSKELTALKYAGKHLPPRSMPTSLAQANSVAQIESQEAMQYKPDDFISLSAVVAAIADRLDLPPHMDNGCTFADERFNASSKAFFARNNPLIERRRSLGVASMLLNKALHHHRGDALSWYEYDPTKRFEVENSNVRSEAFDILTADTEWGSEFLNRCSAHIRDASVDCRVDLIDMELPGKLLTERGPQFNLRPIQIGFHVVDIVRFMGANEIEHNIRLSVHPEGEIQWDPMPTVTRVELANQDLANSQQTRAGQIDGVSTDDLCAAFAGLGWDIEGWQQQVGKNRPQWLLKNEILKGERGNKPRQAQWDPLGVAKALVTGKARSVNVTAPQIDAAFRRSPILRRFVPQWSAMRDDNPMWG